MTSEEKGITIFFTLTIIAMIGWLMFTSNLDQKRCEVYYGDCSELK
jgi:hypothetical protein